MTRLILNYHKRFLYLNKDVKTFDEVETNVNADLVEFLLENSKRSENGKLIMPLLWNSKLKHLLSKNYNLAKTPMLSSKKKLGKTANNLTVIHDAVKEMVQIDAIEKINNLNQYMIEYPS